MRLDPANLLERIGLNTPLTEFYDAPDVRPFEPLVKPKPGKRACVFAFWKKCLDGKTLHITKDNFGCGGAGHWLCGTATRAREGFVKFLVDDEGLKSSPELMNQWLDHHEGYRQERPDILIGLLREDQYDYLKSVTFCVNSDQLGVLMLGAQYDNAPGDPPPVVAPFGSGCIQLVPLCEDLTVPQAIIGAMDIATRRFLPPDILAFTATNPLFGQLCELDEKSLLCKPFWRELRRARGATM